MRKEAILGTEDCFFSPSHEEDSFVDDGFVAN